MNPPLRFRSDGRFRIAQFTDIHWGDAEAPDLMSKRLIEKILDAEKPDLVALTGDNIAGSGCADPVESMRQVVIPMEEREIPWAAVFGNHDDEGSLSRAELMEIQRTRRMSLSERGPESVSGVGNYALTVLASKSDSLAAALYFLDSRSYSSIPAVDGYGWFERDQIEWRRETANTLQARFESESGSSDRRLPALAFFHIPLPEYNEVWENYPCRGLKYEDVCAPRINTGMFAEMVESGDVMGTFVGHDHVNDYEGELFGIRLCYGRWSGYHSYGADRLVPGSRIIELIEGERRFDTWIRSDDGIVSVERETHEPQGKVLSL